MSEVAGRVVPGSLQSCGCYIRLPDYQTVRCAEHAARAGALRQAVEAEREREQAKWAARVPWRGPGGVLFGWALLAGLLTTIALFMGVSDAQSEAAFDAGTGTAVATVDAYVGGWRGTESYYAVTFAVAGRTYQARLADYEPPGPAVGTTTTIEYAVSDPSITRTPGFDSHGATQTSLLIAAVTGPLTLAGLAGWAVARRRARRPRPAQGLPAGD